MVLSIKATRLDSVARL